MRTLNVLLEITIYSGILFCAIMLLKLCFKNRMSPFMHFAIWGLLIVRLLVPVTLDTSVHLFVIPAETSSGTVQQASESSTELILDTDTSDLGQVQPQANADGQTQNASNLSTVTDNTSTTRQAVSLSMEEILLAVWLTGAGIGVLYLAALYVLLRRRIRRNTQVPTRHLIKLFNEVKAELNIKRNVKLIGQCEYGTPAILFPGIVLMPVGTVVSMRDDEVKFVLRHELMHFKRGDHLMSLLLSLLNAVYWFNPIVWLAFKQIHADMETACDSNVVRHFSGGKKIAYAAVILSLFSKKQYGNLVLGMVRGDTKKIAERRIRGVFMNRKSNKKVKVTAILLASMLLFTCFTTACQPTPEEGIVVGKNNESSNNSVQYNQSDFPDSYKDNYSDNGADIIFDATVKLPESDQLSSYKISSTTFSQDQVDLIIKALFGNQQIYAPAKVTKSELEPEYLQALADLKNKQENPSQYEASEEYYQEIVDELRERIENAPETDTLEPVDTKLKKSSEDGIEYWSGRGDLGKDLMATLSIANSTNSSFLGNNSYLEFRNGSAYVDMSTLIPIMQDNGPVKLKITKDEAIQEADDVVRHLGADNMEYAACTTGIMESTDGHYTSDYDPQKPQAYLIYYTRKVNGVAVTYDSRSYSSSNTGESYSSPDLYERVMVAVDDSGVTYIRWQGPIHINSIRVENNRIIPFEDMMTLVKNQLCYLYATYDNQEQANESANNQAQPLETVEKGKALSNEVHIQRITLGLMQVPIKDNNDESVLIPVWDFFGYYQTNFENGEELHYGNEKSLLTINAIDGTIIDRGLGY